VSVVSPAASSVVIPRVVRLVTAEAPGTVRSVSESLGPCPGGPFVSPRLSWLAGSTDMPLVSGTEAGSGLVATAVALRRLVGPPGGCRGSAESLPGARYSLEGLRSARVVVQTTASSSWAGFLSGGLKRRLAPGSCSGGQ